MFIFIFVNVLWLTLNVELVHVLKIFIPKNLNRTKQCSLIMGGYKRRMQCVWKLFTWQEEISKIYDWCFDTLYWGCHNECFGSSICNFPFLDASMLYVWRYLICSAVIVLSLLSIIIQTATSVSAHSFCKLIISILSPFSFSPFSSLWTRFSKPI